MLDAVCLLMQSLQDRTGASLGPISLSFAESVDTDGELTDAELSELVRKEKEKMSSTNSMSTAEWRAKYEKGGAVDLWVEEEFNSGSRVIVRHVAAISSHGLLTHQD